MPGSRKSRLDMPDDYEAWLLAAAWGSYISNGDPGACLYGFRAGGSPPQSPAHRDACLAHIDEVLLPSVRDRVVDATGSGASTDADRTDLADLERLRRWLSSWSDGDLADNAAAT